MPKNQFLIFKEIELKEDIFQDFKNKGNLLRNIKIGEKTEAYLLQDNEKEFVCFMALCPLKVPREKETLNKNC